MKQTFTYSQKIRQLLAILLPVLVTQLTTFAMSFFDIFMSGHYSSIDLAGVAIGTSIWIPVQTGLGGILFAVTPIVAQLIGAKGEDRVAFKVMQGFLLAALLSVLVIAAGVWALEPILNLMNLEAEVRSIAQRYLVVMGFGVPAYFLYTVLRCFFDGLGQTRISMLISLLSLPVNAVLNYVFIYGKIGAPELGGVGTAVATATTYWLMLAIAASFAWASKPFSGFGIFSRVYPVSLPAWKELLGIGIPIGLAIFFETSIFAAVTMLMSQFNTMTIAAHQAAINFASFLYMVPLSISMGLTILVGYEVGAGRFKDARVYGLLGIGLAIAMAALCTVALLLFDQQIAGLYTRETAVLELTRQFLAYAIFFQLADAIAAPIQGVLRGYKDVNITFFIALVSYWVVGLPLGWALARYTDLGPFGFWIGLITGLAFGAAGLYGRLSYIQRRSVNVASM
ncbi:multidrug resistance protein, MATE family [Paenibacillus sp. UNCCL117]|uniref:MATE family efflux transporter n=1 Tax=unclassified Paenibacillus TaxID=185978 RepID=UPI00088BFEA7|nr:MULTISPECIES: MATE family efflux transporter [unclassified Paenibacillus]SDC64886.1 multidrug resistance protein, MATE family [Paenibacillus sp. cl123]SFW22627.1 multidrug resistance protein, MATE family [Paenibacillus sp. UNCCL117]